MLRPYRSTPAPHCFGLRIPYKPRNQSRCDIVRDKTTKKSTAVAARFPCLFLSISSSENPDISFRSFTFSTVLLFLSHFASPASGRKSTTKITNEQKRKGTSSNRHHNAIGRTRTRMRGKDSTGFTTCSSAFSLFLPRCTCSL